MKKVIVNIILYFKIIVNIVFVSQFQCELTLKELNSH